MAFSFSKSSLNQLMTCDERLIRVAKKAIQYSKYDFGISEGLRSKDRQLVLVRQGKSKTLNSRHLANEDGLSEALDFKVYVNGRISWDIKHFRPVMQAFIRAAIEEGVQVEFGGLWESFVDGPHVQLRKD